MSRMLGWLLLGLIGFSGASVRVAPAEELRIALFDLDASPNVGSPLAYDPCEGIQTSLRCRGVVLIVEPQPIVLCAVDWIGIANEAHDAFREALARAAGTTADRVAVHALHQHDAPRIDLTADQLLAEQGINHHFFDTPWFREVLAQTQAAIQKSLESPQVVTHIAWGQGEVEKVASNRRILGEDGKVAVTRWTASPDPAVRAYPVGTIDPQLKSIVFYQQDQPLAALTYYATHPQSYYRTGLANPDFPGLARNQRQDETGVLHVHFNGAGGNIGAGKWNDGSREQRQVLADRVAEGMKRAWENLTKQPITAAEVQWRTTKVSLPAAEHLDEDSLVATLGDTQADIETRSLAASHLAWLRRCQVGHQVDVSCLSLGPIRILHLPGELFVEYQLAAQKLKPSRFVAMAAYGDYGPGYIGTEIAYGQGGYETSERASRVAPTVEATLLDAIKQVLSDEQH